MNKDFTLETKDEIKRDIDHQFIRLATELKEDIENNFSKANEKIVTQQVLINTLKDRIDKAIEKLKEHKKDLDYEPWSFYKVDGNILFDLVNILEGTDSNES